MLRRKTNFNLGAGLKRAGVVSSIPIVALLLLGTIIIMMIFSSAGLFISEVNAQGVNLVATYSGYTPASVTLTMADKVDGEILPEKNGSFINLATPVKVVVSNSDYYDLSVYGTSMSNEENDAMIGPVVADSKPNEFENNTWGYNLTQNVAGQSGLVVADSNTTYQPVPATSTNILRQDTDATSKMANDTYTLNFGAKIDTSLPAGGYSSMVTFSVVANPAFVATGFDRVSTMQELTPEICKEIGTVADNYGNSYAYTDLLGNPYWTKQLRDERDGKLYWVAKLKDGNCWMTQNLALDIPAEGLTSELTGLAAGKSSWKPVEGTRVLANMTEEEKAERFTVSECVGLTGSKELTCLHQYSNYSWNEGEYVLTYPGASNNDAYIGMSTADGGLNGYTSVVGDKTPIMATDYNIITDVSDSTKWRATTEQNFTSGTTYERRNGSIGAKTAGLSIACEDEACSAGVYDAHYLIGNYYQWLAATAQTVEEGAKAIEAGAKVEGSICPRNWELPTSGEYESVGYNEASGSYYNLFYQYSGSAIQSGATNGMGAELSTSISGSSLTLESIVTGLPVHFLRAGYIQPRSNYRMVRTVGQYGVFWSSVVYSSDLAHDFAFHMNSVYPTGANDRYIAYSVRCLVNVTN